MHRIDREGKRVPIRAGPGREGLQAPCGRAWLRSARGEGAPGAWSAGASGGLLTHPRTSLAPVLRSRPSLLLPERLARPGQGQARAGAGRFAIPDRGGRVALIGSAMDGSGEQALCEGWRALRRGAQPPASGRAGSSCCAGRTSASQSWNGPRRRRAGSVRCSGFRAGWRSGSCRGVRGGPAPRGRRRSAHPQAPAPGEGANAETPATGRGRSGFRFQARAGARRAGKVQAISRIRPFSAASSRIFFCSFSKARTSIWRTRSRETS